MTTGLEGLRPKPFGLIGLRSIRRDCGAFTKLERESWSACEGPHTAQLRGRQSVPRTHLFDLTMATFRVLTRRISDSFAEQCDDCSTGKRDCDAACATYVFTLDS